MNKLPYLATAVVFILSALLIVSMRGTQISGLLPGLKGFVVLSGSMSPTFGAGSYILVKETKPEDIQVGDILTYTVDTGNVLTHRVIERRADDGVYFFRTQGDANNTPDQKPVTQDSIIGTAVLWINGLGTLLLLLRQPIGIAAVILLMCLIFFIPEVLRAMKSTNLEGGEDNEKRSM